DRHPAHDRNSAGHHYPGRSPHHDHQCAATARRQPAGRSTAGRRPAGWPASSPTATVTDAQQESAPISPLPLAPDRRSADNRDCPSRTDFLGVALAEVAGGPVGRHALIGRTRVMTPVRIMFLMALVFLALGWSA